LAWRHQEHRSDECIRRSDEHHEKIELAAYRPAKRPLDNTPRQQRAQPEDTPVRCSGPPTGRRHLNRQHQEQPSGQQVRPETHLPPRDERRRAKQAEAGYHVQSTPPGQPALQERVLRGGELVRRHQHERPHDGTHGADGDLQAGNAGG